MPHNFNIPFLSEDTDLQEFEWTEFGFAPKTRKRRKKRVRKPSLAQAIKEVRKVGVAISSATITADGGVSLEFGERRNTTTNENDLDSWITKHAR
jgi:hypothetical protein